MNLKQLFNTSLCSTAIRYTMLSAKPCMLVLSEHPGNIKKWISPSLDELIGPNWQLKLNPKRSIVGIQRKQDSHTEMNYWGGYTLMGNWFLNIDPYNKNGIVYEETLRTETFTLTLIRGFY